MIGGRSALLGAASGLDYGNWTGNYSDVSLLLRGGVLVSDYSNVSLLLRNGAGSPLVASDESPTPKTLTTTGSASISTTTFKYGDSSLAFSGGRASVANNAALDFGTGDFTVECWVNSTTALTSYAIQYAHICGKGGGTIANTYSLAFYQQKILWAGSNIVRQGTTNLASNTWYHFAACRSGGTLRLFVNGTQEYSAADAVNYTSSESFNVGDRQASDSGGQYPLNGFVDDLRVTKGVARYVVGTGSNAGKMVFAGTNNLALPAAQLPANTTDDTSTLTIADESPTPKTLTTTGSSSISTTTFKYGDSALAFDGSNSNISTSYNTAFNLAGLDFTIEMWIRQNSASGAQTPLSYGQGIDGGFRIDIVSGTPSWYINSSTTISSAISLTLNTWQHLAICKSGSTTRLFLDGVQRGSTTATFTNPASGTNLRIGALVGNPGFYYPLNGFIDDLRITKGIPRYKKDFLPPPAQLPAI